MKEYRSACVLAQVLSRARAPAGGRTAIDDAVVGRRARRVLLRRSLQAGESPSNLPPGDDRCAFRRDRVADRDPLAVPALAAPVLMSGDWAKDACAAWNEDPVLTDKLVDSGWVKNDKGRGFKVMQVYRADCGDKPTAEMRISLKDGKAMCVYGGAPETATSIRGRLRDEGETARWTEMGKGEYGPMAAMMFGRLGFDGPEARGDGQHGSVHELPAAGRQGAKRQRVLSGEVARGRQQVH